ncbi:hypothetical protein [Polaribacter sargassicola]|uniref:hypothetical protein n=1 Tax=Polaribacter sargassicola TaxID=2836891 RepID=UPI001F19330E|nr:hypothetical protein [Polaribacter sp. DS7-9]MCG1036336.1 hypothetical protein [Polaribacter sp. DS7-9]
MIQKKFLLFLIILPFFAFAHDANKTFFKIVQSDDSIIVNAEFPWTLRNALLKFKPELKNSKNKIDFKNAFFDYVAINFILKDKNGQIIELLKIEEDKSVNTHSHQNNYIFYFDNGIFYEIQNTLLFNENKNQENFHFIVLENQKFTRITDNKNYNFNIYKSTTNYLYWLIIPFLLLLILFFFKKYILIE